MALQPAGRPWVMRMRWTDLLFAHWPVADDVLQPLLPPGVELDRFDGTAYVGVVPFGMGDVAPRGLPAPPVIGAFPEVNVRTYVRVGDLAGVWFLSLDADSRLAVEGARAAFHLPYFRADMSSIPHGEAITYRSARRDGRGRPAALDVTYEPRGPVEPAQAGSFEAWATERARLFAVDGDGGLWRTEIRHRAWPLQQASASFSVETLTAAAGIAHLKGDPHLCFSRRLDVVAWWPIRVERAAER